MKRTLWTAVLVTLAAAVLASGMANAAVKRGPEIASDTEDGYKIMVLQAKYEPGDSAKPIPTPSPGIQPIPRVEGTKDGGIGTISGGSAIPGGSGGAISTRAEVIERGLKKASASLR